MGTWNSACLDSIRKEKAEIAKRYNIRFGQTEIYCIRCDKPVANPLNHTCSDLRLKALQEKDKEKRNAIKEENQTNLESVLALVKTLGRTKVATLLEANVKTVSNWIDRGKIPAKYFERILTL